MSSGTLHKGLTRKSPSNEGDPSRKPPSGSVNTGATRGGVAKSPAGLGPRQTGM